MKILFRGLFLVVAFLFALSIVKWFFVKLLFMAIWASVICFLVFVVYSLFKRTAS